MFQKAMESLAKDSLKEKQARLDIYLTLSTHDPYDFPEAEEKIATYKNSLDKANRKNLATEKIRALASFLYTDQSLRKLMNKYKMQKNYENTIFIITGDHHFDPSEWLWRTTNVPLLIWSPMLKEARLFKNIVSHQDLSPSILSLLRNSFGVKTPEEVTWLSKGLDTCNKLRSAYVIPQMTGMRELSMFIFENKVFDANGQVLFSLTEAREGCLQSEAKLQSSDSIEYLSLLYKKMNQYVMDNACLLAVNEKIRQRNVLVDMNYLWQALKILKNQSSSIRWFYRRKPAVAVFSGDVPLCLISKLPLSKEAISFDISYQFSIMVEALKKKNRQVKVRTEIKDKNGFLKFQTEDWIVKTGNIPSDSWC